MNIFRGGGCPRNKEKAEGTGDLPLGTVDNILVDAVGDGPVTGGGRNRVGVQEISGSAELGDWEDGDSSQVELSEPLLDERSVGGGGHVDGWVSADKFAAVGRDGEERCCGGLGSSSSGG